jgi:pyridoxamine 5'-phosphate oxidase
VAAHGDPLARFGRWFREARRARVPLTEAMALATTTRRGAPSVRFVLLKVADHRGFVFFTDGRSRKGHELRANPRAAVAFYWHNPGKQVRIEGRIHEVTAAESDAYWATRPRSSQLAAFASHQTATLGSRRLLLRRWRALARRFRGRPVPRPPTWTGFRIIPTSIEFWVHRAHRLHDRELYRRTRTGWTRHHLQP